jgi:ABC-2 type transport system ATP-binding protein
MSNPPTVLLKTENLSLSYGRVRAVDGLNLAVREGEIYGFLGRNGAGKTSTIRMLMGLIRPDAGRIELLEFRGRRIRTKQKQRIGYVSQEQHFYSWMTCQVLGKFVSGFYPTWDKAEFDRLLNVLDLPPHRKSGQLSGGMRVKLALALALAHRPPILILDEPTSGLDPVARREFLEIIRVQARVNNRTTFFSSHLIDEVERVADRVGIIHKGQLCYDGDIETLQASVRRVRYIEIETAADQQSIPDEVPSADAGSPGAVAEPVEMATEDITVPRAKARDAQVRREFIDKAESHGLTVLRDDFEDPAAMILRGKQDDWNGAPFTPLSISKLSLEDIFIALAGEATPQL